MITLQHGTVLATLLAVPAPMALLFRWTPHRLSPQAAYNTVSLVGFSLGISYHR